jgi:hypothetical protein
VCQSHSVDAPAASTPGLAALAGAFRDWPVVGDVNGGDVVARVFSTTANPSGTTVGDFKSMTPVIGFPSRERRKHK